MKSSLFFVLLCLFQINKLCFCLEEESLKVKNGFGSNGFISVTSFGAIGDGKTDDTKVFIYRIITICIKVVCMTFVLMYVLCVSIYFRLFLKHGKLYAKEDTIERFLCLKGKPSCLSLLHSSVHASLRPSPYRYIYTCLFLLFQIILENPALM